MTLPHEGLDFFVTFIQGPMELFKSLYPVYLDNSHNDYLENVYRVRSGNEKGYFYVYQVNKKEHEKQTIESDFFKSFLHFCIDEQQKKLEIQIVTETYNKTSSTEIVDYVSLKLRSIYSLILISNTKIDIKEFTPHIIFSLKEIANHYLELYKKLLEPDEYQYLYNCFNEQQASGKEINDNIIANTFRQSTSSTLHPDIFRSKIDKLFELLRNNKFIHVDTDIKHFRRIFGIKYDTEANNVVQVVWTRKGANSALRYLIRQLYLKDFINSIGDMWEVTGNCFRGTEGDFKPTENNKLGPIGGAKLSKAAVELEEILTNFLKDII